MKRYRIEIQEANGKWAPLNKPGKTYASLGYAKKVANTTHAAFAMCNQHVELRVVPVSIKTCKYCGK